MILSWKYNQVKANPSHIAACGYTYNFLDGNHSSRNYSSTQASTASISMGRGHVVRTARVPLLYPCRYAREKLSVRESDRRCSPLAFCPRRTSVGRARHYRKHMYSIRRFRTKLTFRRNLLLCSISFELSHYYPLRR